MQSFQRRPTSTMTCIIAQLADCRVACDLSEWSSEWSLPNYQLRLFKFNPVFRCPMRINSFADGTISTSTLWVSYRARTMIGLLMFSTTKSHADSVIIAGSPMQKFSQEGLRNVFRRHALQNCRSSRSFWFWNREPVTITNCRTSTPRMWTPYTEQCATSDLAVRCVHRLS